MWRKMRYIWMAGLTGFGIPDSGFQIQDSGFQDSGFRISGPAGLGAEKHAHTSMSLLEEVRM